MAKTIRSIHFLTDRVVVDYGEHKQFQFCKHCHNGAHLKAFLSFMSPELDLQALDADLAIHLERRFFYNLARGPLRSFVNRETYTFSKYVHYRCTRLLKQQKKRQTKAAAMADS